MSLFTLTDLGSTASDGRALLDAVGIAMDVFKLIFGITITNLAQA